MAILRSRSDLVRISGKLVLNYAGSDHNDRSAIVPGSFFLHHFSHFRLLRWVCNRILLALSSATFFVILSVLFRSCWTCLSVFSATSELCRRDKIVNCDDAEKLAKKTIISANIFSDSCSFFGSGIELSNGPGQAKV